MSIQSSFFHSNSDLVISFNGEPDIEGLSGFLDELFMARFWRWVMSRGGYFYSHVMSHRENGSVERIHANVEHTEVFVTRDRIQFNRVDESLIKSLAHHILNVFGRVTLKVECKNPVKRQLIINWLTECGLSIAEFAYKSTAENPPYNPAWYAEHTEKLRRDTTLPSDVIPSAPLLDEWRGICPGFAPSITG